MRMNEKEIFKTFEQRCIALFALVQAEKPEKGIATLIARAKAKMTESPELTLEQALEIEYQEAKRLTENRLNLLGQCKLH